MHAVEGLIVGRHIIWLCLVAATGCSWLGAGEAPAERDGEAAALRAEVRALRAELRALREEVDVAHDVVVATPGPGPREAAQRADFDRLEGAVDEVAELTDAVDLDLDLVEGLVQELQGRLAVAEAKVGSIEGILNNHADVLDALSADVDALRDETDTLRPLNGLLFVDGDRVILDGVDLEFRPGKAADGSLRTTGLVMTPLPTE